MRERDDDDRPFQYNSTMRGARRPMRKMSKRRERERRAGTADTYGQYFEYVKNQYDCALADHPRHRCEGPIDAHHVILVSAGGVDAANLLPLCRGAHTGSSKSVHGLGSTEMFDAEWHIDSEMIAAHIWSVSPWGPK